MSSCSNKRPLLLGVKKLVHLLSTMNMFRASKNEGRVTGLVIKKYMIKLKL